MAVRLLAGPFDMRPYGAPDDWQGQIEIHSWVPGIGLLAGTAGGGRYATLSGFITLDGLYCDRSIEYMHESSWDTLKRQIVNFPLLHPHDQLFECAYDSITLARERTGTETWSVLAGHPLSGKRYVKLANRSVFFNNTLTHCITGVVGATATHEGPPLPVGFANANVFPGRVETEVWIGERFNQAVFTRGLFYDTVTQQFSSPIYYIGMGARAFVYIPELGVFVSGHDYSAEGGPLTRSQLRVWSMEVEPTVMSPVVLVEGLKSGRIAIYRVNVQGSHKDPAVGEMVAWTLTGAGTLLDAQSRTDVDGNAVTRVQYLTDEIGTSVVEATLPC